ncbi:hypothetical protein FRC01_001506, partial [Tulasnella sp. 417]
DSPVKRDHSRSASREMNMLAATRSPYNRPLPLNGKAKDDDRTISKVDMSSVQTEGDDSTTAAPRETSSTHRHSPTARTLGSSTTLVDRLSSSSTLSTLDTVGSARIDGQIVDKWDDASAGGEVETSPHDAPIYPRPVSRRKPGEVKRSTPRRVLSSIRQHARTVKSSIGSSFRGWGNAASNLLSVRRPAKVEANAAFNPYFDPWEGFVPPRGPSPDLTQPDDDLAPPNSNIQNVYINLDELVSSLFQTCEQTGVNYVLCPSSGSIAFMIAIVSLFPPNYVTITAFTSFQLLFVTLHNYSALL